MTFKKWDIVYITRFPETIQCTNPRCGSYLTAFDVECRNCGKKIKISNLIAKIRPVILWKSQSSWHESMSFGIPLSASRLTEDMFNEVISLSDYTYLNKNPKYQKPMRAVITQSSRIDGNLLTEKMLIGKLTNQTIQSKIENKLLSWLFD